MSVRLGDDYRLQADYYKTKIIAIRSQYKQSSKL